MLLAFSRINAGLTFALYCIVLRHAVASSSAVGEHNVCKEKRKKGG